MLDLEGVCSLWQDSEHAGYRYSRILHGQDILLARPSFNVGFLKIAFMQELVESRVRTARKKP
jgi:hypothetical protein